MTKKKIITTSIYAAFLAFYPTLQNIAYQERGYYAHGGGEELMLILVTALAIWGWWE